MISFDEFIKKWNGKSIDWDGIYPNQCFDLAHAYIYEVLGFTDAKIIAHPAAYQIFTEFSESNYFTKIFNTPTNVPQKGDIVVFGTTIGSYGHVCIFTDGNVNSFNSFDANWPVGSLPHIQKHNYNGVLGWLRVIPQAGIDYKAKYEKLLSLTKQVKDILNLAEA